MEKLQKNAVDDKGVLGEKPSDQTTTKLSLTGNEGLNKSNQDTCEILLPAVCTNDRGISEDETEASDAEMKTSCDNPDSSRSVNLEPEENDDKSSSPMEC